ncbi:MAG: DUF2083 domain-containing protein [Acidobacteria bacterium]|nr:DUF2083 domain-containing protein [Acidobacteriota bacterium]
MERGTRLGARVRSLRRQRGLTQAELAEKLGISASYMNLIEHDQRPLTATLLLKAAQTLGIELDAFREDDEVQRAADLQEVFGDPLFDEHPLMTSDLRDLASSPALANAITALYRAYRESVDSTRALAGRLYDEGEFAGLDPASLPSEEVSDVLQTNMNYFPELEAEAERVGTSLHPGDVFRSMVAYLRERYGVDVVMIPAESDRSAVRRYDPIARKLSISEMLIPSSRTFQTAYQVGNLEARAAIDGIISRSRLTTPESIALCRVALANYFASALLMPYRAFLRAAEALRYDVELLESRFGTSFEQVCHRLTTLRRPGEMGVSFHFVRVDIAGNVSKRFSGTGIRFSRFSGSCPRWDVFSAFLTPEKITTQISKMPDGPAYFCVARTVRKSYGGYHSPSTLMAVGIGCDLAEARRLVYADGIDLGNLDAAIPIGTSCRLCERLDCEQRAFPPITYRLSIDENVRGISFYAPVAAAGPPPAPVAPSTAKRKRKATR